MTVLQMSTTHIHGALNGKLYGSLINIYAKYMRKRQKMLGDENVRLTFEGKLKCGGCSELVDISQSHVTEEYIGDLDYIQPDIFLFDKQPFQTNKSGMNIAGFPDLIIEIWSDGNTQSHRKELHNLYMTSPVSEVWYLNQEDTIIERWYKQQQLPNLDFRNLIQTQDGIEFDLRDLAE
ncbi:MAG: Uma2 family endonuclease [Firmicutes bacterium]|nr:Uma2 family endonuclease [Bacillota bacterium]